MTRWFVTLMAALSLVAGLGCKSEEEKRAEEAQKQFAASAKQMGEAMKNLGTQGGPIGAKGATAGLRGAAAGMQGAAAAMQQMADAMKGGGAKVEPVDFRSLKALLPESLAGWKRTEAGGEKAGAMGFSVSQAKARYKGDGGASLKLEIVDTGGLVGPMAFAAVGLATVEVDKETEDGYEKTSTLDGRKSFEKWNSKSKRGEVKVVVANRFVVEIDGDEIAMDDLKAVAKKIDYGKLESLGAAAK